MSADNHARLADALTRCGWTGEDAAIALGCASHVWNGRDTSTAEAADLHLDVTARDVTLVVPPQRVERPGGRAGSVAGWTDGPAPGSILALVVTANRPGGTS